MDISGLGEFGLIDRIRTGAAASVPGQVRGIGDDCAVIPQKNGLSTLVSTDMLIEGSHFLLGDVDPWSLGYKSAAVNVSDIAAMGGRPCGTFLAFALPKGLDSSWMDAFMAGFAASSLPFGAPLLGGDTTSSPDRLCICVTVLGECESGREVLRSGARPSDLVCVTGTLGDSAGGLNLILGSLPRESAEEQYLVGRHYRPAPRVPEGLAIAAAGASAMLDVSDGIGSDLRHILDESGTGAVVNTAALPVSHQLRACAARYGWNLRELAIDGGEDYELLFTIAPDRERMLRIPHTVIGEIREGSSLEWRGAEGEEHLGFRHF